MWEVVTIQKPDYIENHSRPRNDLRPHAEGQFCKCEPRIEVIGNSLLICHNSFDGREMMEAENIDAN